MLDAGRWLVYNRKATGEDCKVFPCRIFSRFTQKTVMPENYRDKLHQLVEEERIDWEEMAKAMIKYLPMADCEDFYNTLLREYEV